MGSPVSRRLGAGLVLAGVSAINLAANGCWRTGDVHHPNLHAVMRGGWTGFWVTTVLFAVLLVVGLVLLALEWRHRRRVAGTRHS